MDRNIPAKLVTFLKSSYKDVEDGYEYASELNRILNSDECQKSLQAREIEILRDFANKVRKLGDMDCYTEKKIKDIEMEHFGSRGVLGFLGISTENKKKPACDLSFLFNCEPTEPEVPVVDRPK